MTSELGWPDNVVDELIDAFRPHMSDYEIVPRPVRVIDPELTLGVFSVDWTPEEDSYQTNQIEPALAKYLYRVQVMVKVFGNPEEARLLGGTGSKIVRAILYRDINLRVRLQELSEELLGSRERYQRSGVQRTRYYNNDLASHGFVYLAVTDLWVETETVQMGSV